MIKLKVLIGFFNYIINCFDTFNFYAYYTKFMIIHFISKPTYYIGVPIIFNIFLFLKHVQFNIYNIDNIYLII